MAVFILLMVLLDFCLTAKWLPQCEEVIKAHSVYTKTVRVLKADFRAKVCGLKLKWNRLSFQSFMVLWLRCSGCH